MFFVVLFLELHWYTKTKKNKQVGENMYLYVLYCYQNSLISYVRVTFLIILNLIWSPLLHLQRIKIYLNNRHHLHNPNRRIPLLQRLRKMFLCQCARQSLFHGMILQLRYVNFVISFHNYHSPLPHLFVSIWIFSSKLNTTLIAYWKVWIHCWWTWSIQCSRN